jgi:hypothetical protein
MWKVEGVEHQGKVAEWLTFVVGIRYTLLFHTSKLILTANSNPLPSIGQEHHQ